MRGAFSILHPFRDVSGRFNASYNGPPLPLRYNTRPIQHLPVILNRAPGEIILAKWGIAPKWTGIKMLKSATILLLQGVSITATARGRNSKAIAVQSTTGLR